MKKVLLLLIVMILFSTSVPLLAQDPFQLFITSYERKTPAYICKGEQVMDGVNLRYALVNLSEPYKPLTVDSFHYQFDTNAFVAPWDSTRPRKIGIVTATSLYYTPYKVGTDTIWITGYYGPYTSMGMIIAHAKESPNLAFYGVTNVTEEIGGGYQLGGTDEVLAVDTLRDLFRGVGAWYDISSTPQNPNSLNYNTITLKACGTVTIDSIYTVGDFTDIEIEDIPSLPYVMNSGDVYQMKYVFTPTVPGKTPHYLVVHTTDGEYLVWSFEYGVLPLSSVKEDKPTAQNSLRLYPNPAREKITVALPSDVHGTPFLVIYDETGKMVSNAMVRMYDGSDKFTLDVSNVPSGSYTLRLRSGDQIYTEKFIVRK